MFPFTRRAKTNAADTAAEQRFAAAQAASAARQAQQEKAQQAHADLIARLSNCYYHAHALSTHGTTYQTGVADGAGRAIAEVLGKDYISVGYRLSHGLSLTTDESCVIDTIDGKDIPVILNGTGTREPVSERLDHLHRKALKADNHPMYHILYGTVAV